MSTNIINKKIVFIFLIILGVIALFYVWTSSQLKGIGDSSNYKNILFCPSETRTIIDKYNINEKQIEGCQSKSFELNGKDIILIHLEYGIANDCLSGCFFSHYCAIVDNEVDYPYAFYFSNPDENILNLEFDDWRYADEYIMTGRIHKLANTQEFNNFLIEQRQDNGEFRWCK